MSRTSKPPVKAVSDEEVRALLDRYWSPVPFHAVRTRFLGNIASEIRSLFRRQAFLLGAKNVPAR